MLDYITLRKYFTFTPHGSMIVLLLTIFRRESVIYWLYVAICLYNIYITNQNNCTTECILWFGVQCSRIVQFHCQFLLQCLPGKDVNIHWLIYWHFICIWLFVNKCIFISIFEENYDTDCPFFLPDVENYVCVLYVF